MTNILLIDDDTEFIGMISTKLKKERIDSKSFENSKEGLSYLKSNKENINLAVLDLLMPEMSGWVFMKEMIKGHITNIPVIVLTNLSHTDIPTDLNIDTQMVIKTDISMKELVELIKTKINGS